MTQEIIYPDRVEGRVKWFDPLKGFGFIVAETGGPDILLHSNVLRNYGQSSVADGAGIVVEVQETPRGVQAVTVVTIEPPEDDGTPPLADFEAFDPTLIAAAPLEPARVKWFDKGKGFGFANVFGKSADVFLHVEVLRRSGLADVQAGEALCVRAIDGKRGLMAVEVCPWESALKPE
ncbi:cold shock domain-containing protein [Marinovum sp. 2_MG-2023]|uniref:cold-shock protein n=1 Tax=Roseobacteraceae TaxID=2854170 RepID=UPI001FD13DF0|nr:MULTISPECIES: cold shock domain-containing protein [Roseobacteraceae]MCJ7873676.1 cold shock domain-containing protein [Phaeobacter sp. J2-8]MDO6730462.1 cold shock domain-containing protein [Marinovum sp. 2_MG-2023]MDO6778442.1 cold shock domain-containing protein [Marinovum sp. 1_MG-2023]